MQPVAADAHEPRPMSESYDVGTRAWQPDVTEGWVASEVTKKTVNGDKVSLVFDLENGEVGSSARRQMPSSANPDG